MTRKPPSRDIDESQLTVGHAKNHAAGPTAVAVSMKRAIEQMGVRRTTTHAARKLNQVDGFDCQGCAWPDPGPDHRHTAEFCENGAKAVAEEATRRRVGREFFAAHPIAELADKHRLLAGPAGPASPSRWCCVAGATPLRADHAGTTRSRWSPTSLRGLASPDEAIFYTSGRTSNEAAFAYQLFARALRHQQPARLLEHVPRVHLGGAGRGDRHRQGHGHPRGRAPGRADRDRRPEPRHQPPADAPGARAGQEERREDHRGQPAARGRAGAVQEPADPARPASASAPALADLHLPVRVNGDLALFQAIGALLLRVGRRRPRLRRAATPSASRTTPRTSPDLDWAARSRRATGLDPGADRGGRGDVRATPRATVHLLGDGAHPAPQRGRDDQGDRQRRVPPGQHRQAGRRPVPGARPLQRAGRPHHGHLGAGAKPALPRRARATSSASTRRASTASTPSTRSVPCATAGRTVFFAHGRQLRLRGARHRRSPRRRCATRELTVQVSTKLNRSHVVHGDDRADPARRSGAPRRTCTGGRGSG